MNNYVCVAFSMLLLYDHIITLDMEVEWIWTLRWRPPKIIFLINRYLLTSLIVLWRVLFYPLSLSLYALFNATPLFAKSYVHDMLICL
ncbi:hypothetical protein PILCRDRAFT_827864 [Piloderma croceum F 1598]|uniref:DUF6533 domain-containing protein n=1 Tax=Piloderma croceum (strain F 1598) TaxID=765440 RepID=A0A0C3F4I1_PILCF|nr:hypothetical protein PILCRDRAFT_827864 [Piloderma croceum F 1598]